MKIEILKYYAKKIIGLRTWIQRVNSKTVITVRTILLEIVQNTPLTLHSFGSLPTTRQRHKKNMSRSKAFGQSLGMT